MAFHSNTETGYDPDYLILNLKLHILKALESEIFVI